MNRKRYRISKRQARERLERRYAEQCALFPLTSQISLSRYISHNIEAVRKYDLLQDYRSRL